MEGCESRMAVVYFRGATLRVSDPEDFEFGKACGQAALLSCEMPVGEKELFRLFADGVSDIELSESRLLGFFLGLIDTLLRDRKNLPPGMP